MLVNLKIVFWEYFVDGCVMFEVDVSSVMMGVVFLWLYFDSFAQKYE